MPAPACSRWEGGVLAVDEDTRLYWPGHLPMAGNHRLVIFGHGRSGQESQTDNTDLPWSIAAAGFVFVSGDFAGPYAWGNDTAISRVQATIDRARAQGWASNDPPLLVGASMGALTVLNWHRQAAQPAAGCVLLWGGIDLAGIYSRQHAAEIDTAYGGSYSSGTDGPHHDPQMYASTDLTSLPIRTYYAEDDTQALASEEAEFAASINGNGGSITRTSLGNTGHFNFSALDISAVVADLVDLAQ